MSELGVLTNDGGAAAQAMETSGCHIVPFRASHAVGVRHLFIEINKELAPAAMEAVFSSYVQRALEEEIDRISTYYDFNLGNGFWVVTHGELVVGMFGLERSSDMSVELRRMYLKKSLRGRGLAADMLQRAEEEALKIGYRRLVLSTADIQRAALAFYKRNGFRHVGTRVTDSQSHKTVGRGLTRLYFQKELGTMCNKRERVVRWADPSVLSAAAQRMSGRQFLETVLRGELPLPPICNLVDFTFEEFGEGLAEMKLHPSEAQYNPIGTIHGGVIATILDSVMGCAVHTVLPVNRAYTTLELKVNYLRAVSLESGDMRAIGKVVHAGRKTAMAESELVDESGRVHAKATTTCLLFDLPANS